MQNRRHFLKTGFSIAAAGLAGAAALVRARGSVAEEAPPETTSVRLLHWKDYTCLAPIDILDDLLRDEGFADVRYVPGADSDIGADRVASGDADFVQDFAATNDPKDRRRRSRSHAGRGASGLFRAVRPRIDPQRRRSEGQDRRRQSTTTAGAPTMSCSRSSPPASGSIPPRTSIGSPSEGPVKTTFSQTARSMRS